MATGGGGTAAAAAAAAAAKAAAVAAAEAAEAAEVAEAARRVAAFPARVVVGGLHGHWLCAELGTLEISALARAAGLHLELYTWDARRQAARPYFSERAGDLWVGLFFSGAALTGHFDLLLRAKGKPCRRPAKGVPP
ncbi:hypothetical protein I4F81_000885 [Pyropia yezoensis]|uniref:Uncharacterized protein n=1 Tax=Pyropia yezoensis TaxID=2788 RepID=A0ACC3BKJ8_PYRYE|nr:hypothetical protein I4F81_000885 [Neopyropia yezoensis]